MGVGAAAGRLDHERHASAHRVPEELGERLGADPAGSDVLVPVLGRAAAVLGVVGVDQLEPLRAGRGRERVERGRDAAGRRQVVSRREGVTGVEADARPWMPVEDLHSGNVGIYLFRKLQRVLHRYCLLIHMPM